MRLPELALEYAYCIQSDLPIINFHIIFLYQNVIQLVSFFHLASIAIISIA